ncbi:non-ribosomal peptide synthetase [Brevibacillus halotolerans]|uniref:non-ribosomal peptide synthetase n=1 Tax=Brevibacillus halotolerans TaxID=1507437 RepID=UPI0015EF6614|nr:non-ribosomal peptide synthetase [Brevibacillus halotolerans]MBA4532701.1 amino acid adenylation domain-containing protein [Brevibacillus halotolerans]
MIHSHSLTTPYLSDKTIHQLFESQAEKTPDNPAIILEQEKLTYQELNSKANQLARLLIEKGVQTDQIVGIFMDRSIEMVISILAILKAGGAYVPIDVEYPQERIQYMLKDSQTKIVLTQHALVGLIREADFQGQVITFEDPAIMMQAELNLNLDCKSTDLAYVIYTSGTTGNPKGTMLEHKGIVNLIDYFQKILEITPNDRVGQFASISFDASVSEFFMALLTGASLYMIAKDTINDFVSFETFMNQHKISIITLPPTYLIHLNPERILYLRKLITAGSATSFPLVNKWKDRVTYMNAYGPTESSICASTWIAKTEDAGQQAVPIGSPIQNTQIYILNPNLEEVPFGETGELCISGIGLARGYWNLPELTSEKFITHPYLPGEKMYKTGDLAKWRSDGTIEYIGRMDHQVKIRGHRVELGEVETVLLRYHKIREAAVIAKKDELEQAYLCAYFVETEQVSTTELREHVAKDLPVYMIPSYFVRLDKMPLTPNDKIDRKALPEPHASLLDTTEFEAPTTEIEAILAEIWQSVLGNNRVGIHDNFYALGGDSIKAIQVAARLYAYQLKLETKDLLKHPTITEIVPLLKQTSKKSEQGIVEGEVGLTPIQQWFFDQQFTNMHHYNQSYVLSHPNGIDEVLIRKVFDKMIEHHDALRMVYKQVNGRIKQINRGKTGPLYDFFTFDLRSNQDVQQAIYEESYRLHSQINLNEGPLVKLGLFHTQKGDHLFIAIHHLIVDGISWRILFEDISTAYAQVLESKEIVLPEKTDSFQEWSLEIEKYATSKELLHEIPYWQALESIAKPTPLPKDFENSLVKQNSIQHMKMELSVEDTGHLLKNVNHAYQTEINDILLSGLSLALLEWAKVDQILINVEGHGREDIIEQANIARTVGWFTCQYPVLVKMDKSDDLSYHIKSVKENLRKIPNKGIGYEILKYKTAKEINTSLSFSLQPSITFNYLGQFDSDLEGQGFTRSPYSQGNSLGADGKNNISPEMESNMVLHITGVIENGRMNLSFSYSDQQYKEESIKQLGDKYKYHLLRLIRHCMEKEETERTPSDFSIKGLELEDVDDIFGLLEESMK